MILALQAGYTTGTGRFATLPFSRLRRLTVSLRLGVLARMTSPCAHGRVMATKSPTQQPRLLPCLLRRPSRKRPRLRSGGKNNNAWTGGRTISCRALVRRRIVTLQAFLRRFDSGGAPGCLSKRLDSLSGNDECALHCLRVTAANAALDEIKTLPGLRRRRGGVSCRCLWLFDGLEILLDIARREI